MGNERSNGMRWMLVGLLGSEVPKLGWEEYGLWG
jgi:hypothetical protein